MKTPLTKLALRPRLVDCHANGIRRIPKVISRCRNLQRSDWSLDIATSFKQCKRLAPDPAIWPSPGEFPAANSRSFAASFSRLSKQTSEGKTLESESSKFNR